MLQTTSSLQWYPMRVTYNRELRVKESLDALGIESFIPMRISTVAHDGIAHRQLVPAIHNLIFIRSTRECLTDLKQHHSAFEPLRYILRRGSEKMPAHERILVVPDVQMENFMRVASMTDDSVMYLNYNERFLGKEGQRVRITGGKFEGVEGVIRRIRRNKHVVVQIDGLAAVAIVFVPGCHLMEVDDKL